jgi:diadenylate cyclase
MLDFIRSMTFTEVITSVLDIAIVAYVLYRLLQLIRGTRAVQVLTGIMIVLTAGFFSKWLHLYTVTWLIDKAQVSLLVALPVVFYPEIRRALEQLGRGKLFKQPFGALRQEDIDKVFEELARTADVLSRNKIGALIVLERESGLTDIVETGTRVDGVISSQLLINIFIPNTPLHDGAVIVSGDRIVAAGCFLPLTEQAGLAQEVGTRHRAAIGVSEASDALALVVSEETGIISLAHEGKLVRNLDGRTLKEMLSKLYQPKMPQFLHFGNGGHANG